eukprot:GHVL01020104.1.p1 GENE.GHVL01020104.1~~GHVL01020104.1.p1  ORF type:complete len:365 (+),score=92.09 GHVL01020104.1:343-1437(+)
MAGDCFDISILLTSLLIGVGYDAFAVMGKAPSNITLKDETNYKIPKNSPKNIEKNIKNTLIKPSFQSKWDQKTTENKSDDLSDEETFFEEEDVWEGKRCHCWVLIRKGGNRDLPDDIFIESTTGMSYKVDESPYLFIDSLWNDTNYWINMTPRGKEISFSNLKIPKYFEAVLPENPEKDDEINAPLLLPLPWGCLPVLSRENFNFRFFKGERCGFYKKSQILNFSPFSQPDGLIRRHSIFKDVDRQIPSQINHIFYARKDGLVNRIQYPLKMEIFEEFKNIRPDSIKSIHKVEGESIDVEFYSDSRLDGVCRRTEIFDKELSETFIDRKDKLTFHSIKLDPTIECKNNEDLGIKVMNKTIFVKK